MVQEKMNVHKALCELKVLEDRITKKIQSGDFVFANKHSNQKVNGVPIVEYIEEQKSIYQSVNDLIARREAIKRAVTMSNATTKVVVSGNEYTVAEAIEMKNNGIPLYKNLLYKLSHDNRCARDTAQRENGDALEKRADQYVFSLYGNVDKKNISEDIQRVRSDFIASQTIDVVDTIGVMDEIAKLEEKINNFTVEIDSALSVSNALTEIEIFY